MTAHSHRNVKERLGCFTHAPNGQPINIGLDSNVERDFDVWHYPLVGSVMSRADAVRMLVHNLEKQAFDACF